jgi:ketosteroid isomerase-like protein
MGMAIPTRRALRFSLLLLCVLSARTALASPDPTPTSDDETLKAVTAVKQAIVAGHKARDRAALDKLYADDYTATDASGKVTTKKELLDGLATWPEIVEGRYEIRSVRRWGNVAVAPGHGRLVYRNPDGSTRVSEYDSVNVFELVNGRWLYVAAYLP